MDQKNKNNEVVTIEEGKTEEENPLLVAQRYLNIFRQIHIFKDSKRAEFDNELLNLPEKIKRYMMNIPGGSILVEHILDLETENNYDTKITKALLAQKKSKDSYDTNGDISSQALSPLSGELKIGGDFANVLATSLATAFGKLSLPQLTSGGVPASGEIKLGDNFANALAKSLVVAFGRSQFPQQISTAVPVVSSSLSGDEKQVNTQNNMAATTVNHINVDYSIFQNLADAINKSNEQTHDDFMRVIDVMYQSMNLSAAQGAGTPMPIITPALEKVLKENSKQQIEEMKAFGKVLTESILASKEQVSENNKNKVIDSFSQENIGLENVVRAKPAKSMSFAQKIPEINMQYSGEEPKGEKKENKTYKDQTISVIDKVVDPLTAQSTVKKKSYSIPIYDAERDKKIEPKPKPKTKPKDTYKDPLLQAQSVLARTGLSLKPLSLSPHEEIAQKTLHIDTASENDLQNLGANETPTNNSESTITEYELDENLNMKQINDENQMSDDEKWEYVDENGNPITDAGDEEWEYVDENGNPITDAGDEEWEYVDENGNPITDISEEELKQVSYQEDVQTETTSATSTDEENISDIQEQKDSATTDAISAGAVDSVEETTQKENKEAETTKSGGILSSLFKKFNKFEKDSVKKAEIQDDAKEEKSESAEETKKDTSADDALAAAFGGSPLKAEDAKSAEEPKNGTLADDILAAAFGGEPTNAEDAKKEHKVISSKDLLSKAFENKDQTANNGDKPVDDDNSKKKTPEDILSAAFGQLAEAPKKSAKIGGILAEAYKEAEKDQKVLSSKDLLSKAFGEKPAEEAKKDTSAIDALAAAFGGESVKDEKPAEDAKKDSSAIDALAAAFGGESAKDEKPAEDAKKDTSAIDALAAAFGGESAKDEKPAEDAKKDTSAIDALAAAFGGESAKDEKPAEEAKKDSSAIDALAAAFGGESAKDEKPAEEAKKDSSAIDALAAAFGGESAKDEKPAEEAKKDTSAIDALAAAFGGESAKDEKPAEEAKKDTSAIDALAAAFGGESAKDEKPAEEAKKDTSADDALAAAFGEKKDKTQKHDDEFEALLKAFNS